MVRADNRRLLEPEAGHLASSTWPLEGMQANGSVKALRAIGGMIDATPVRQIVILGGPAR